MLNLTYLSLCTAHQPTNQPPPTPTPPPKYSIQFNSFYLCRHSLYISQSFVNPHTFPTYPSSVASVHDAAVVSGPNADPRPWIPVVAYLEPLPKPTKAPSMCNPYIVHVYHQITTKITMQTKTINRSICYMYIYMLTFSTSDIYIFNMHFRSSSKPFHASETN